MSTIDIRTATEVAITELRFADADYHFHKADTLKPITGSGAIDIKDSDGGRTLRITSKEHADNLRKALDKAETLGWLK